jgi:lipoprotein-releasing system ATP-binding protein
MEGSQTALLEVRGLGKQFRMEGREVVVLREVDLSIYPGEMVAIVGASGAGKSTLLHILGTLDGASEGTICFEGRDLSQLNSRRLAEFRNRHLGFVFQFHHLLPEFNAIENAMMPGLVARLPREETEARARTLLKEVGLGHRLHHRPGELSGGEQQRVALARALLLEPKLLLADEPTGNLDTMMSEEIHELLFEINARHGTTLLAVTHNAELADRMPRRLRMVDGRIIEERRESGD